MRTQVDKLCKESNASILSKGIANMIVKHNKGLTLVGCIDEDAIKAAQKTVSQILGGGNSNNAGC